MIKFKVPAYNWALVARLSRKTDKPKLWERTGGTVGRFKDETTRFLREAQGNRCAYCRCFLFEDRPARDHIAPKNTYPEWTFRPENLVLACYACNTDRKKTYDPVSVRTRKYRRCKFSIIHPYFDDPRNHIEMVEGGVGGILVREITDKGRETISLFDLMHPERAKQRAGDIIFEMMGTDLNPHFKQLLDDAIAVRNRLKSNVKIHPV